MSPARPGVTPERQRTSETDATDYTVIQHAVMDSEPNIGRPGGELSPALRKARVCDPVVVLGQNRRDHPMTRHQGRCDETRNPRAVRAGHSTNAHPPPAVSAPPEITPWAVDRPMSINHAPSASSHQHTRRRRRRKAPAIKAGHEIGIRRQGVLLHLPQPRPIPFRQRHRPHSPSPAAQAQLIARPADHEAPRRTGHEQPPPDARRGRRGRASAEHRSAWPGGSPRNPQRRGTRPCRTGSATAGIRTGPGRAGWGRA